VPIIHIHVTLLKLNHFANGAQTPYGNGPKCNNACVTHC